MRKLCAVIEPSKLEGMLATAFPDGDLALEDLTGSQDHYQARIVSRAFEGKSPIEQHQMVYRALGDEMNGPIHALALKTYTPAAWARLQGEK